MFTLHWETYIFYNVIYFSKRFFLLKGTDLSNKRNTAENAFGQKNTAHRFIPTAATPPMDGCRREQRLMQPRNLGLERASEPSNQANKESRHLSIFSHIKDNTKADDTVQ